MSKMTQNEFALKCRDDVRFFVINALKAEPSSQQLELLNAVQAAIDGKASKFISVRSSHGTGKTTTLSWLTLWFGLTMAGAKIPVLAPTQSHIVKQIMPECLKWTKNLYPPFKEGLEIQSQTVKFKNGNEMFAKAADPSRPEAVAGIHSENLLFLIDEASGISDKIFEVLQGALTEENFIFLMTSNPTRVTGHFYNSHHKLRSKYQCLHWNTENSTNITNDNFADMISSDYGKDSDVYRVRVLGEFPNQNAAGLFPLQLIEEAMERHAQSDKSGVRSLACDVAGFGDDKTCIAIRRGMQIDELQLFSGLDTQQVASTVSNMAQDAQINNILVDGIGIGAGVLDTLKHSARGKRIINAHAGKQAEKKDIYFNKRSEMYFEFKNWLQDGGAIPDDPALKEELLAQEYFHTTSGKIQLVLKKTIKETLGRSPDRADACAFNFYEKLFHRDAGQMAVGLSNDWSVYD